MNAAKEFKAIVKPFWDHIEKPWRRRNARYIRARRHAPLKKNTILYESFYGRGMLDNPYALFLAMLDNPAYKHYKHIWVLDNLKNHEKLIERYKHQHNVSFVEYQSPRYTRLLATCQYLVNNVSYYPYFLKREDQVYINTWHGIPLKCLGYDMATGRLSGSNVIRNFLHTDYLISANPFLSDVYKCSHMLDGLYQGEIVEEGYPRLDLLVRFDRQTALAELADQGVTVDPNKKIVLYAPTWKGSSYASPDVDLEPYLQFKETLEHHIDTNEYQVLIKVHQVVYESIREQLDKFPYMVPATMDANVVLSVTDILVSDYSSIFYDFLGTGRPVLFYIPDLESYTQQRGLYTTVEELPGPYTQSLTEVTDWINDIDAVFAANKARYDKVRDWCCDYPIGHIAETIVDHIWGSGKEVRTSPVSNDKKKIAVFVDTIRVNGILNSLTNLLNEIDYDKFDVTVISGPPKLPGADDIVKQFHPRVRYYARESTFSTTSLDELILSKFHQYGAKNRLYQRLLPSRLYDEELCRLFGSSSFDYSVDFGGFSLMYAMLAQHVRGAETSIWMHSDMASEQEVRMKWLSKVFSVYPRFDHLVSCSKDIMLVNREKLATPATRNRFTYCKNAVNYQRVEAGLGQKAELEWNGVRYCLSTPLSGGLETVTMIPLSLPKQADDASETDPTRFLMIGRLSPEKNYEAIIHAFANMVQDHPQTMLYIVGDGPLRDSLQDLICQLDMQQHIILVGLLGNPSILMPYCQCFVLSSLHEGQPIVLHEARVAGMPIIMTRFSSYTGSIVDNGQYLVDSTEESLEEGLRAFMEGRVPTGYKYDHKQNNREVYHEFLTAIGAADA